MGTCFEELRSFSIGADVLNELFIEKNKACLSLSQIAKKKQPIKSFYSLSCIFNLTGWLWNFQSSPSFF